ncbi:MAG: glycosyltransferase family 1 protein [bacterium]|nr:glycosyltransferase family 1 protein [bacterium]
MKIGINLLFLLPNEVGGTETYSVELLRKILALKHNFILFTNSLNHDIFLDSPNIQKKMIKYSARNKFIRVFHEQHTIPKLCKKYNIDILFSPGYTSPINIRCATVVTIPDLQYKHYSHYFSIFKRFFWEITIPRSIKRCERVVTISNNSLKELKKFFPKYSSKYRMVYPAVRDKWIGYKFDKDSIEKTKIKYNLTKPYLLSVATMLPHKNLYTLLKAFSLTIKEFPNLELLLVGKGSKNKKCSKLIKELNIENNVKSLGYVNACELPVLYKEAAVYAFPSLFEGFGFPLVEAQNFGCPVVSSINTCLPEIGKDGALYFNPLDAIDIHNKIRDVLKNDYLKKQLINNGFQNIKRFSWEESARDMINIFQEAYIGYENKRELT